MSHFCLIAGVGLPDCDYRVAGNLLLLLAISEIIPGLAGRIRWLQKCLNVSIMFEKSLLCSLQINITKDITSIVQWVEEFFMIPFFWTLYYCLLYFNSFTILVSTVNTQPAIAYSGLAMETLEQGMWCVWG